MLNLDKWKEAQERMFYHWLLLSVSLVINLYEYKILKSFHSNAVVFKDHLQIKGRDVNMCSVSLEMGNQGSTA